MRLMNEIEVSPAKSEESRVGSGLSGAIDHINSEERKKVELPGFFYFYFSTLPGKSKSWESFLRSSFLPH